MKYNILTDDYKEKKTIAIYELMVTNTCYLSINALSVQYIDGVPVLIYYSDCNMESTENKKIRVAKIDEKTQKVQVIDAFNKHHGISLRQFYRVNI